MKNMILSILGIFLVCLLMSYIDVTTKVAKTYYILLDRYDSTVQYREDTVESSSRIRQWYSLYSDDHSEWGVLFKEGVDSLKIVPLKFLKTTQEILMNYRWVPIDIYDDDDREVCFVTYTKTQQIDSTKTEEGKIEIYTLPYYLSNVADSVFDKTKVGKVTTGKYLIMNASEDPEIVSTIICELVELSEEKMVIKHLTPWLSTYSKINTFLAYPKE